MKIPETRLQFCFILLTERFPTMTWRHKFGVRGQGGGGEEASKWWEVTEKQSEKIAGLGSKEKCRTEHKEVSCYLRATGLGKKRKIHR